MTNLLVSIIIAIGLVTITSWSAMELFQGARDNYDQQMTSLRLEQVGAAVKSKIRMIDGLPTLPAPIITSDGYPALPTWISANATDTNGHQFVYCPYALRPTTNIEGTQITSSVNAAKYPGYNIVTYASSLFGTNSPPYVVGSDKPTLSSSAPPASLTPGAPSGYGVQFTASSAAFSASSVGQMISSGGAAAIITTYTDSTHVLANITQNFPSTSAISSGNWNLSSVAPKGLLGFVIAFKPHDTYSAAAAQSWCNHVNITTSGGYTTANGSYTVNGLVYPIIVGQSQYQQAYAKSDNVTYYVAPTATGDTSGRNPSNRTTLQGAIAQLAALHPARATVYLASGTHKLLTEPYYAGVFEYGNLRGITLTLDGTGNSPTVDFESSYDGADHPFDLPVNLILKNLTLDSLNTSGHGTVSLQNLTTSTKWIFDGITVTANVPVVISNNLWLRGTTSFGGNVGISAPGKVYVNGNVSFSDDCSHYSRAYLGIGQGAELNILPGGKLTGSDQCGGKTELEVQSGGALNVSGLLPSTSTPSLILTSAVGVQSTPELLIDQAAFANFNNAAVWFNSGSGVIKATTLNAMPSSVFVEGEMNANDSAFLFPSGVTSGVAGVDLLYGGKFTLHNGSVIGSSGTTADRPYYGVYDEGGISVGGCGGTSNCGYSSGAAGEGGSPQSNIYVQNTAGAMCWSGAPTPAVAASGSAAQQRHLFMDSPEGNGTTSAPRGTHINTFKTTTASGTALTIGMGTQIFTIPAGVTVSPSGQPIAQGEQVSIVSNSNAAYYMSGYVVSYSGTSLTVNVTAIGSGSGTTVTDTWTVAGGLDMRHLVLANQTNWACNSPVTNSNPVAFNFATPGTWCGGSSPYITETILPTGYNNSTAPISITDLGTGSTPQYSLDGGHTWTTFSSWPGTGTIAPGQTLTLQLTPSTYNGGTASAQVTIGSTSTTVSVNTTGRCFSGGPLSGNQVGGSGSNSSYIFATLNHPTTAGDLIVATAAFTVANSGDGGYFYFCDIPNGQHCVGATNTSSFTGTLGVPVVTSFYIPNIEGNVGTFLLGFGSCCGPFTPANVALIVTEYNVLNASPLDQYANNSPGATASINPSQASELIVGYNGVVVNSGTPTITPIYPTSHTISVTSGPLTLMQTDGIISSTATQTASYTDSGDSVVNATAIDSFKLP